MIFIIVIEMDTNLFRVGFFLSKSFLLVKKKYEIIAIWLRSPSKYLEIKSGETVPIWENNSRWKKFRDFSFYIVFSFLAGFIIYMNETVVFKYIENVPNSWIKFATEHILQTLIMWVDTDPDLFIDKNVEYMYLTTRLDIWNV